jgi:hypothetical protein
MGITLQDKPVMAENRPLKLCIFCINLSLVLDRLRSPTLNNNNNNNNNNIFNCQWAVAR